MPEIDQYEPTALRRSGRQRIRGVDYHLSEWGRDGDPLLLFLHGWGDTGACFQFVVDELDGDFHVIAPDWRGFGNSAAHAESFWFPDYIADLHELLQSVSPDRPACLVGHSMGGNVAGLYAGIFPERVAAFVNVEGFGLKDSDPASAPANYRSWIEQARAREPFKQYASYEQLAQRIVRTSPRLSPDRAGFVARQWAFRDRDGSIRIKADAAHRLPNATLYRRAEARACWQQVAAPVCLVSGADSRFAAAGTEEQAQDFPHAIRKSIPDAGHMVHFEQPAALAVVIRNFLRDL